MEDLKLGIKTLRRLSTKEVARVSGGAAGDASPAAISGIGCDENMPTYYCTVLCTVFFCSPTPSPGPDPTPTPVTVMHVCSPGPQLTMQ